MPDPSQRLAHTVLGENLKVRRGESVVIETWTHGLPYARALAAEARRLGARATVLYEDEEAWWDAVGRRDFAAVGTMSAPEKAALAKTDVYVYLWGPEDRPRVAKLPDKIQDQVTGYNEGWYDIARKNGVRGVRLAVAQATDPVAAIFGFDGPAWRERLVEAGSVPAAAMRAKGARVAKAFTSGKTARLTHPNGTDLTVQLRGATARSDVGEIDAAARKRRYGF